MLLFITILLATYFVNTRAGAARVRAIEVELPLDAEGVRRSVGDADDPRRKTLLANQALDSLLFIPSYTFLFLALSWLLSQRSLPSASWLGVAAGACAFAAAACDYLENARMNSLLSAPLKELSQGLIDSTRHASLAKWAFCFVTSLLLSSLFLWRRDWLVIIGAVLALASCVGLLGCVAGLLGSLYRPLISYTFYVVMLGDLGACLLFLIRPDVLLRQL